MTNTPEPTMPPPPTAGPPSMPSDMPPPPTVGPDIPSDAMIVVRNLSKWFGDLVAVSDVTFGIGPGVTALLGPNGAGKSTVLRMLCGMAAPSSGEVRVLGRDPRTDPTTARHIGLAPQQESVFDRLTALEFVRTSAELQGLDQADAAARHTLQVVELDPDDTRMLPTYSKGMRQRVKLAQAIIHNPEVILLDEPLSGLDPGQRLRMVELFHYLGDQGRAVVVSSHVLEEVQRFGSNVLVIAKGRLAAQGDFREIRALMDDRPRRLRVRTDQPNLLAADLVGVGAVKGVQLDGDDVIIDTDDIKTFATWIAPIAQRQSARLFEVQALDEDLESVFRYLVGDR